MSSSVEAILKATVGLLVNKGRNVAAEKLKEGDVTNEQLRNLIVRQLYDIKSKLDGRARRDLLASIEFFEDGLVYLIKVKPNEEDGKKTQHGEDSAVTPLKQDFGAPEASVKTVSLAEEMRFLQLTDRNSWSGRALNHAKEKFKEAQKKATDAFCNEALSTPDRILAMQYCILATILEKVDCLTDALPACRLCLGVLHSMPAVKESLDVHLQPGFKSMFNKAEREDTIRSVCRMSRVIFYVAEIVEDDTDISLWPCVDHGGDKVNPLRDVRVTEIIENEDQEYFFLKAWPFFQEGEETTMCKFWFMTTNTKGQLIIVATHGNSKFALLKVFDRNGNRLQSLHLKLPVTENNGVSSPVIRDIASDRANNVFLLVRRPALKGRLKSTVIVFDQHANFQHEFDVSEGSWRSRIVVSDDNKAFVSVGEEKGCVQVYNFNGVLLNSIESESLGTVIDMTFIDSEGGKIVVLGNSLDSSLQHNVYQFSEQRNVFSLDYVVSHKDGDISLLHKTEYVAMQKCDSGEVLSYIKKNGEAVRRIILNLSALKLLHVNSKPHTVTTQGLVAMLATDKRTGKTMIVIV